MSIARHIGFYGTPPILLGLAFAAYRFWFAGPADDPAEQAAGPPEMPPVPPPIERDVGSYVPDSPPSPSRPEAPPADRDMTETGTVEATDENDGELPSTVSDIQQAEALLPELAARLSANPALGRWATVSEGLRRLVAAVDCIANGTSPRRHLAFLEPATGFTASRAGDGWVMSEASMARYDRIVEVACSVNSARCIEAFRRLEPALNAVYRHLGYDGGRFRDALAAAGAELCAVPVPSTPIRLVRRGPVFEFADARLAGLSEAQKHLVRSGPENTRRIQNKIRQLAGAAGMRLE